MFLFQLRNELWKLFGKKRTYIGFLIFVLGQTLIVMLFRFAAGPGRQMTRLLELNGFSAQEYISSLTVATFMLFPIAYLLLPLFVSLVGGDFVAKEAEDGTLRMILARPVTRLRLLGVKWVAGAVFAFFLSLALGVTGLTLAALGFHWGGLFVANPGEPFSVFGPTAGWHHYVAAHLMLSFKAVTIMSLAFMFSCFNVKPATATILALSFVFVNSILQNIPYFSDFTPWFLTYHLDLWRQMFTQPVPWWKIFQSLSLLAGFNLTFFVTGATAFFLRDIKT
jgi:ABC-2 type transport system permease protein